MKAIGLTLSLLTVVFLPGCSIRPLGFFEVEPFAKPAEVFSDKPLNLVIMDEVRDSFLVEGEGLKKMTVTDFRRSFVASMENVLSKNFQVINVCNVKPDAGLTLVIYRVKPFWTLESRYYEPFGTGGDIYHSTRSLVSAAFRFESTLFLDDKKIREADETVYSDDRMTTADQAHAVFKDGLTKTCELIHRELFRDRDFATK